MSSDNFDDDEASVAVPDRRTILHPKALLAQLVALVERPNPALLAVAGTSSLGQIFSVRDGVTLGRAIGVEIALREDGVSRRHAVMRVTSEQQVFVSDLGSSNGVYVNGSRIESESPLRESDFLQLGNVTLMLIFLGNHVAEVPALDTEPVDAVTHLPSRANFMVQIEEEFSSARSQNLPLSLFMFSIEGLWEIEARSGVAARDELLARVARAVREAIQEDDRVLARYGEDSFALLVPGTAEQDLVRLAEWLRLLPRSTTSPRESGEEFDVCLGSARLLESHRSHHDLVWAARHALYLDRARETGGGSRTSAVETITNSKSLAPTHPTSPESLSERRELRMTHNIRIP